MKTLTSLALLAAALPLSTAVVEAPGAAEAKAQYGKQYAIEQFLATTAVTGASFSADEKRIVFSSDRTGIRNVYAVDVGGGEPVALTRSTSDTTTAVAFFPKAKGPEADEARPAALDEARQLLLVTTASWDAVSGELRRFERDAPGGAWRAVGAPAAIVVGKKGLAWDPALQPVIPGPRKAERDGRSPAGAFTLGAAFGYAATSEAAWLKLTYFTVAADLECVDDPASRAYNQRFRRSEVAAPDWKSSEKMREVGEAYRWGVVVEYNTRPAVPGRGSCIFLHIGGTEGTGTAGCTAMPASDLEPVMRWLDPAARPVLVQLPRGAREALAARWQLPS